MEEKEFDPYDMSNFKSNVDSETRQKINAYNKRQKDLQSKMDILSENPLTSWQPEWFVQWSTGIADKGLDLINGVSKTVWEETKLQGLKKGKTLNEIKKENPNLWNSQKHIAIVQDTLDDFATEYIDDEGNTLDVIGLIENGEILKAGEVAAEQAVSNIFSFLATGVSPIGGGVLLASQVYGQELASGLDRYNGKKEIDYDKIRLNSFMKAGSEFIGEYIGGTLFRKVSGLRSSGLTKSAVKTYTDSFVKKLTKGLLGGFGSEFLAEGFTNSLNQLSDQVVYEDEKTFKDYFRGFINDGIVGGMLGGPLGGGMQAGNSSTRKEAIRYAAPRKWQTEMHKVENEIQKAEENVKNANGRTKEAYQKRLDLLNKKKSRLNESLDSTFENKTDKEIEQYAQDFDDANKQFDIALDANKAPEERDAAKKEIERLYSKMRESTDGFVNVKTETVIGQILKTAEVNKKKGISSWWKNDLDIKYLKNDIDVAKAIKESGESGLSGADGMFMVKKDGKYTVYINEQVAAATGATNVLGHELLHYVFAKNFQTDNASMKPLVDTFKQYLVDTGNGKSVERIENRMKTQGYVNEDGTIKDNYLEEYFEMFTDLLDEGQVKLDETKSQGIVKATKDVLVGLGLVSVELNNGKQVFDFLKLYHKNLNRTGVLGKITKRGVLNTKLTSTLVAKSDGKNKGSKKSRTALIDDINNLQKGATTKAEFQQSDIFNNVFKSLESGGAVNNYIRSLQMSPEKTQETIDSVTDRLINFDPAAKRKDGTVIGPKGLGEFIMANVGFGKLDAAKALAIKGEKTKRETSIDTEEAKELTNEATETKKQEPKGQKARVLKSLADVNLDNKEVISTSIQVEIENLIKQNPVNLEVKIQTLIEKEITKAVKAQMGKISNVKGEVVVSEEYKAFIALNYKNIVESLDVTTIKNNYKTLFELTQIGKEDKKTKREGKKDSNFRKGIYKIETNKAKFTKFFIEGGYTTLLARQKGLAKQIAEGIVEKTINNAIINESNNTDAIIKAKLSQYANNLNKQKNEVKGNYNDQVKFSKKKAMKDVGDVVFLLDKITNEGGILGTFEYKDGLISLTNNERDVSQEMIEFVFEIHSDFELTKFTGKERRAMEVAKILQKVGKNYPNVNNGVTYEQFIIEVAKMIPGIEVLSAKVAEGGIPDLHVKMHGQEFFVEVKMANAQYSSVTVSDYNISTGKFVIKKDYGFNPMLEALVEKSSKGIKAAQKFVNDLKYVDPQTGEVVVWKTFGQDLPTSVIQMMKDKKTVNAKGKKSSIYTDMSVQSEFEIDNIGKMYKLKEYPVYYIHIQGKGLFHMGENPLGLPVPKLTGDAFIKIRPFPNNKKRVAKDSDNLKGGPINKDGSKKQVKTGYTSLGLRMIPTIDAKSVPMSEHSLGNMLRFNELMNTKEVKSKKMSRSKQENKVLAKAIYNARTSKFSKTSKGITVLDFDDTLATSKSLIKYTQPDGTKGTLTPEQYASTYQDLQDLGYKFDFSEFNKVVDGKIAPLFQKALKLQSKFGPENMFVLTARPAESAPAIFAFIKANGLNIPLKNITGLANSTAEAKALWIADKVGEGYNDFYFADDALQNVQAVDNMLDQFDVKRKVQQAKVKFSNSMINKMFNDIIQDLTGIDSIKRFDATKARKRGSSKGKFRYFIPPSHEDFVGLLYNFMGKGRKGDLHRDFFEETLVRPLNRANREYDTARQSIANDYKLLNDAFPQVKKMFGKKTPDGDFTYQDAIRVYLWNKHGYTIPGLSPIDQKNLVELVESDSDLKNYADSLNIISKQENYVNPLESWESGDIRVDLDDATGRVGRAVYFDEFQENADIIFSTENLNKIEAGYGKGVREALEDVLYRIKTGRNRPSGQNALVNRLMNYINGAVGSVMFFNIRSSLLQQMSIVNYFNFADNNIFAAAKAFANQPQYWKDWAFIFNSDMLKQRRGGIQTDVNGSELYQAIDKSNYPIRTLITKLLQLGFLPTQIGDNIAIATGGAMYYRNRINKYLRDGLSQKEAESKAFTDFQNITQSTQQSARPDMVSQQQASPIGKLILAFQNVTSQFNRLGKKAFQDIYNRRITPPNSTQFQSDISNASRITYYFAVQNLIFYSLQTALFAALFDDDENEEEFFTKKRERLIDGSIDSVLRGSGMIGAVVATLKNMAKKFAAQRDKSYNPDESSVILEMFNLSPPLGIKARKIVNAEKTLNYNKKVMKEMETFDIDNPVWSAVTNYMEGVTNVPVNRIYNKTMNVRQALDNQNSAIQRALMFMGWSQYNLGIKNKVIDQVKKDIKKKNKKLNKKKRSKMKLSI